MKMLPTGFQKLLKMTSKKGFKLTFSLINLFYDIFKTPLKNNNSEINHNKKVNVIFSFLLVAENTL